MHGVGRAGDDALVDDLRTLIAFPTVSSRPVTAIAAFLAERFEALGFTIERFDDPTAPGKTNVVCTIGPADSDGLVLSGHMDVVPTEGQPWTGDPFAMRQTDDGQLIGRGTADMKGFLAACLTGLARLDLRRLKRQVILVWTHDEEVGCHGSAHLARTLNALDRRLPAACWIGEPTDFQILRKHAGHVGVEVRLSGRAAHSAYPELGANAVVAAGRIVAALDALGQRWANSQGGAAHGEGGAAHGEDCAEDHHAESSSFAAKGVPLNVGNIHGGTAINIVPDRCVLQLGFRPQPGMGHGLLLAELETCLDAVQLPAGTGLDVTLLRVTPSLLTRAGTDLQALLTPHASSPDAGTAGYATDGGNLVAVGCEPLIFGPGSIKVAHQADEHVSVAALVEAARQVAAVVTARCF